MKGQIVISLLSRDGHGSGSVNVVVDRLGNLSLSPDELPEGWVFILIYFTCFVSKVFFIVCLMADSCAKMQNPINNFKTIDTYMDGLTKSIHTYIDEKVIS